MFDPNSPLPDFASQSADIEKQKMLADMLRKMTSSGSPKGQMVGPHYVAPSLAQQLMPLAGGLGSMFADKKAGEAQTGLNTDIAQARQNWQSNLPQITPALPGRPELPGPAEESGSPELGAVAPVPAQIPGRGDVLRATLQGMAIPGNKDAAMLWNKGMGEEVQREDTQAESRQARSENLKQQKELEANRLAQKADEARQRSEDTRLSIDQRKAAAAEMAEYRRSHDETLRAIAQMKNDKPAALKPLPAAQAKAWTENGSRLKFLDQALTAVNSYPKAFGTINVLGNALRSRTDPKGVDARAIVGNIGSLKVHDRSGAAVTASETPRLQPFIPVVNGPYADDAKTIAKKLKLFKQEIDNMQSEIVDFADTQGYKSPIKASSNSDLPAGLVLPPGAKYIGPAP